MGHVASFLGQGKSHAQWRSLLAAGNIRRTKLHDRKRINDGAGNNVNGKLVPDMPSQESQQGYLL